MQSLVTIDGLIEFTPAQIEQKASDLVRRRVDVSESIPVDVELLLENTQNVELETLPGLLNNYGVEGCVCTQFMTQRLTVFVDKNLANGPDDARYNEIIGEELAHIELHRAVIQQIDSVETFVEARRHPQWRRIEADAVRLSMAIRLRPRAVEEEAARLYQQVVDIHGFADPQMISRTLKVQLAERFAVSVSSMERRLSQWPLDHIPTRVTASVISQRTTLLDRAEFDAIRNQTTQSKLF